MIIRPDIIARAKDVLSTWRQADEFSRVLVLLDWSAEIDGITTEEISVILYPDETLPNGAPTLRARKKARHLVDKVRHHPSTTGMVIFAIQRGSGWFNKNIREVKEWGRVRIRMEKTVAGFQSTIKVHNERMKMPLTVRKAHTDAFIDSQREMFTIENAPPTKNKRQRKKKTL
jgi:hypothetical protein